MRVLKKRAFKRHAPKQDSDKTSAERIKPFLLLFKLCGLFANDVTAGQVKRCSWPTYGICALWIGLFVSCICYLFTYIETLKYIRLMINFAKHLIGCVSLSVDVLAAYSSQNHFSKFFDRLDGYDHEASRVKNKRRDNLWIPGTVALLTVFVSLLLATAIMHTKMVDDAFVSLLSDTCTIILHMYSFLEKFLLLYLILERFKHLNKTIAPNVSWDEGRRGPDAIEISNVKIMHSMLYNAHEVFNDIYRNPLLLSFTSLMLCTVANLNIFRKESALVASPLVGAPMMLILIMCIICHRTAEEANNIVYILNKNMTMLVNSGKTMTKISTLTYFLHACVSFDAARFFTIDLPLFQSIVAAITTYFLILV